MKHALDMQKKAEREKLIEQLRQEGIIPMEEALKAQAEKQAKEQEPTSLSWMDVLKTMLMKPWAYIMMMIIVFSPYSVQILNTILQFIAT